MKKLNIDYIVLDYVQLFKGEKDEVKKLNYISREMMYICKEYKVPIIYTSQANSRESDKTSNDGKLHMGHLKGSGALEENARHISLIYGDKNTERRTVHVGKNTWGSCGDRSVLFDGRTGRVVEVDYKND